jgi:hypothetical protein
MWCLVVPVPAVWRNLWSPFCMKKTKFYVIQWYVRTGQTSVRWWALNRAHALKTEGSRFPWNVTINSNLLFPNVICPILCVRTPREGCFICCCHRRYWCKETFGCELLQVLRNRGSLVGVQNMFHILLNLRFILVCNLYFVSLLLNFRVWGRLFWFGYCKIVKNHYCW